MMATSPGSGMSRVPVQRTMKSQNSNRQSGTIIARRNRANSLPPAICRGRYHTGRFLCGGRALARLGYRHLQAHAFSHDAAMAFTKLGSMKVA